MLAAPVLAADKADVAKFIKQLKSKDEIVRLKAAKSLGKLGADAKDAIPALTDALKDDDDDVRSVAKAALAKIKAAIKEADQDQGSGDGCLEEYRVRRKQTGLSRFWD
jgi:HEAT repeat protein